jgi:hypothetical protein
MKDFNIQREGAEWSGQIMPHEWQFGTAVSHPQANDVQFFDIS